MAPESERAMRCADCGELPEHWRHQETLASRDAKDSIRHAFVEPPNDPTLTCSEVVERLAEVCGKQMTQWNPGTGAMFCNSAPGHEGSCSYTFFFNNDTPHPPATDSWRERRVQELEEALRKLLGPHEWEKDLATAKESAERLLANSEQIRKGQL